MLYNATIGTAEEIWNTGVWGARMVLSDEYRQKFVEDTKKEVDSAGGLGTYLGTQSALFFGGALLNRAGIRGKGPLNKKHDDLGGGSGKQSGNEEKGKAEPSKVVNALDNFQSRKLTIGDQSFLIDKRGMKHILERHHPDYWDGSIKAKQTFLNKDMTIDEVADAIESIMKQNRDTLLKNGTTFSYQIKGRYNGVEYVVGFNKGRVGQFYPE